MQEIPCFRLPLNPRSDRFRLKLGSSREETMSVLRYTLPHSQLSNILAATTAPRLDDDMKFEAPWLRQLASGLSDLVVRGLRNEGWGLPGPQKSQKKCSRSLVQEKHTSKDTVIGVAGTSRDSQHSLDAAAPQNHSSLRAPSCRVPDGCSFSSTASR